MKIPILLKRFAYVLIFAVLPALINAWSVALKRLHAKPLFQAWGILKTATTTTCGACGVCLVRGNGDFVF